MYKFIMVDDEKYALEELSQMMDWEKLGFELVGIFNDVDDALEYIEMNSVDVILSDIKMPGKSGIDFARICNEVYPDIIFILMSAYRDFEYARASIQYNVKRYILKPISFSELELVFEDVFKYLNKQDNHLHFPKEELLMNRQALFLSVVHGIPLDDIESELCDVGIYSNATDYPVLIFDICIVGFVEKLNNVWKYGKESFYGAINKFICSENEVAYYSALNYAYDNISVICLGKNNKPEFVDNVERFLNELKNNLKEFLNIDVEISIKYVFKNLSEVVIDETQTSRIEYCVKMIFSCAANGEKSRAQNMLKNIFEDYRDNIGFTRLLCKKIAEVFNEVLSLNYICDNGEIPKTRGACYEFASRAIDEVASCIEQVDDMGNNIIMRAIEYVEEHYSEEITLVDVSNCVSFNPNYFSKYFKKYTGEKFVDFLTRFRIEKAIDFMNKDRNASIQTICEKVGYNSMPHFYKVFRAYTGCTPAEYRKMNENKGSVPSEKKHIF